MRVIIIKNKCLYTSFFWAILLIVLPACKILDSNASEVPDWDSLQSHGEYRIAANDLIEVSFLDEPEYTQEVRVDWSGKINLTFLGRSSQFTELAVVNKTSSTLTMEIDAMAKKNGVLREPRSHVRVIEYAEQTFSVLGHVFTPGRHPFPPGQKPIIELGEAIALAGGYTEMANLKSIYIKRKGEIFKVNLKDLLTIPGEPVFWIVPGDVITVLERII